MAGKLIETLRADMPVPEAVRRVLKQRLRKVVRLVKQVEDDKTPNADIIHQLRVSTRRASAALVVFEPFLEDSSCKRLAKSIGRIRRAAGQVRDWDIFQ